MNSVYVGINMMGFIFFFIMYFHTSSSYSERFLDQKLFKFLLLSIMLFLVCDTGMYVLDGAQFSSARILNYIFSTLYYLILPFPGFFWLLYSDYVINQDKITIRKRIIPYSILWAVSGILTTASLFNGWVFSIDQNNYYHRGPALLVIWLLTISYIATMYFVFFTGLKRKKFSMTKETFRYLFIFPLPPVFLSIIQLQNYGVLLLGMGMMISVFIIFINVQNRKLYVDELTGAFNRHYLEGYLSNMVKSIPRGRQLFGLMVDIDDLKSINDAQGRVQGDRILIDVYEILKKIFKKDGIVSRFGDDEFIVLGQSDSRIKLDEMVQAVETRIESYNTDASTRQEISVSIGTTVYQENGIDSADAFLRRADDEMQALKMQKQENLRRVEEYQRLLTEVTNGLYESIYEMDVTHNCAGGKSTREYFERLGISGNTPYNEALQHIARKEIKEEYRQGYLDTFSPEHVLKAFDQGIDRLSYEFLISQNQKDYYWLRITARIFFWEYDHSVRMLTYRQNVDEEKKREMEPIQKAQRLEDELAQTRIAIMLNQIQPHFIYNILVVMKQLCDEDPQMAKEAIGEFSDYLRNNLDALTHNSLVSLKKEMEHVKNYISLEKKRFGNKINIIYDIKIEDFLLPAMTIQPVVENAIRYGITKKDEGGAVTLTVTEEENHYRITVSDDGVGFDYRQKRNDGRSHIGLENVQSRLQAMCGGSLRIQSVINQGTQVIMVIPKGEV